MKVITLDRRKSEKEYLFYLREKVNWEDFYSCLQKTKIVKKSNILKKVYLWVANLIVYALFAVLISQAHLENVHPIFFYFLLRLKKYMHNHNFS